MVPRTANLSRFVISLIVEQGGALNQQVIVAERQVQVLPSWKQACAACHVELLNCLATGTVTNLRMGHL
jgi:hypothetical protein